MTDPYELHPETEIVKRKPSVYLTIEQVNKSINKEIEEILAWKSSPWGFAREDFLDSLENLKEELKNKCRN